MAQSPTAKTRRHNLRVLHRWTGLIAGVILLVASVTGSALVYKKALIRTLVTPDASLPPRYGVENMATALDRIAQLPAFTPETLIKAPSPEEPYWTLGRADGGVQLLAIDSLEPYTTNTWLLDTLAFLRTLHTVLLAGVAGEVLLFASAVAGLGLAVTGAAIWWRGRRAFRWRWVFPKHLRLPHMLQYHRHSGALSAIPLVLVLLTGALMLWQKLTGPLIPPAIPAVLPYHLENPASATPGALLEEASRLIPDGWPTYIRLGTGSGGEASIRFRLPGEWHPNGRTSVTFNRTTGAIQQSLRADEGTAARRLLNQLYPLHSGYGLNALYGFLVLVSGVAACWLGVTGFASYIRRRRLERSITPPR